MEQQKQTLRFGAWVILLAVAARLISADSLQPVLDKLSDPAVQSFLIYIETGRNVRFSSSSGENANYDGESPAPVGSQIQALPVFAAQDGAAVSIRYSCSLRPDPEILIQMPLTWDLTGGEPTVLILHTHTTESYTKAGESYKETSAFRTLNENYNMLSIGDKVAAILSAGGISVIHDRELHDYPSYNGSYNDARESMAYYLEKYPTVQLVLDLHRDASGDNNNQMRTLATVAGQDSAQLMMVVGTDASGLTHPEWEKNLSLALKLHSVLESQSPGITRPITLRAQRFNQDLSPGALLVEVGAAGNTHAEALRAAEALGEGILALAKGSG